MAKRRKEELAKPSKEWMNTFADLMNLLLCFFVLLFSMSTVDAQKFELIAASFSQTFSIFSAGSKAIGDGRLISNGVSQLNQLDQYIYSTGKAAENEEITDQLEQMQKILEQEKLTESEKLAEKIQEAINENQLQNQVEVDFTSQYVQLTLKGAILFDSGSATLKAEAMPTVEKVGLILERYIQNIIEIEGHTDNVPISTSRFANNNELSSARALAMFDYLVENTSLQPAQIKHSGRGEYVPIADNSTPEGRAKNRRIEIRIYNILSGE
ncbi:MAG: flagellar motor protein MotB [Lachnospiraceae bacterium]|nr:flagellar motor protein MotB [Lachnospiraceae bacterium]MDD7026919.1 flagellar motor protein MotB [Lachnospiraceae bacterium]MDY5701018.1 flagellar motor protein MotB [Lachnospiraceae bacterium]